MQECARARSSSFIRMAPSGKSELQMTKVNCMVRTQHSSCDGTLQKVEYWLHGTQTSAAAYQEQCQKDPTLPKPEDDPLTYKKRVPETLTHRITKYKALRPVAIPLDASTLPPESSPAR